MVLTGKSETCCVTSLEIYALDLVTKDTHRIPDPHKQASAVSVSGPFPLCLCAEIGNQGISCADKLLSMKKTHGFSGPHEGYAGCNPHESLCWIKSSPLRQLVLKYWNGWNFLKKKKSSEKPWFLCEVCFPSSQHCQRGPWEDFSEASVEAKQERVEGWRCLSSGEASCSVPAILLVQHRSVVSPEYALSSVLSLF